MLFRKNARDGASCMQIPVYILYGLGFAFSSRPYSHTDKVSARSAFYYSTQFIMEQPRIVPAEAILIATLYVGNLGLFTFWTNFWQCNVVTNKFDRGRFLQIPCRDNFMALFSPV